MMGILICLFLLGMIFFLIGLGTEKEVFKLISVCISFLFISCTCVMFIYSTEKTIDVQEVTTTMNSNGQFIKIKTYDNEYYCINVNKADNLKIEPYTSIRIKYLPLFHTTDDKNNKINEIIEIL